MRVDEALVRMGGFAVRAQLIACTSRAAVDRALRDGTVVAVGRGRYSVPDHDRAVRIAHGLKGVLCLTSAAVHHGWEVKTVPDRPHVALPRGRRISGESRRSIELHRHDLHPDEVSGIATSRLTTSEMCLRSLPFDEALCVADSYLRHDGLPAVLRGVAASARGPGSRQVRRVADAANGDAANPFESVLRAIALTVSGLRLRPQAVISSAVVWARPDLVDEDLRIVLEADSFAWHGDRAALHRDAVRYNLLVADGWRVLRFSWEQVMFHPEEVRRVLELVVRGHTERTVGVRLAA